MPPKAANQNNNTNNKPNNNNNNKPNNNNKQNNNNNNNNNTNKDKDNTQPQQPPAKKEKKGPPQKQLPPQKTQEECPPVVMSVSTPSAVKFMQLPLDPEQFPKEPKYLENVNIPFPTSDVIWTNAGDRCAACTSEGIMVYTAVQTPGATFDLKLVAQLPNKTSRYLQFSPMGNYLLSYETHTKAAVNNLIIWDLRQWANGIYKDGKQDEQDPEATAPARHPSVAYTIAEKRDLPRLVHSTIQWTDDEEYCFVLQANSELHCFELPNMVKPYRVFQQKGLQCFQLSKIPRGNDKMQQFIALYSPSFKDTPAVCKLYRTLDVITGQSWISTYTPSPADIACGKFKPGTGPIHKWGNLQPRQTLCLFRSTEVQMSFHNLGQALLVRSSFDDGSSTSYYAETRLYVMYADREPVAVSFGDDSAAKGDIHACEWNPTGFEFASLHGPSRNAQLTLWSAKDCSAVRSVGAGPWNIIRFSPNGKLMLLAGFGALSGKMEIWEKQKLIRLWRGQDDDSPRTLQWTPCGRYFLSATLFPYLRVGNQLKISRWDGKVLYKEQAKESAIHRDIKSEKENSAVAMIPVPSEGHFTQVSCNYYPRNNYFDDLRVPQDMLVQAQKAMQEELTKPAALPPGVSKFSSAASRSKYVIRDEQPSDATQRIVNQPVAQPAAQPRDFAKERKANGGNVDLGIGAKPVSQLQQQPKQQQQQTQQKKNNNNDDFGSWRR